MVPGLFCAKSSPARFFCDVEKRFPTSWGFFYNDTMRFFALFLAIAYMPSYSEF